VGINDLKGIGLLRDKAITRNCADNIIQILETCEKDGIRAIYTSIFPPGDMELIRRPFWDPGTVDSLRRVNMILRDHCLENGHIYFDTYKLLEDQHRPGMAASEYQQDFLHINARAYEDISGQLQALLRVSEKAWAKDLLKW
jgi:lysophospholipase L1-like esterase